MENIYVQFDGTVYQQKVGIPMGTNFVPLIADLLVFLSVLLQEGFYIKPAKIQTGWPHRQAQRYLSISWRYIHHW